MRWDHRVVVNDGYFEVCEVFYDDEDRPWGFSTAHVGGDNMAEVQESLLWCESAFKKPILAHPHDFDGEAPGFEEGHQ